MNILTISYLSTNYYLLDNGKHRLLVDAGWPGTLGRWQHVLRSRGVLLGAGDHFFVTHFHPDHAGLVQELKEQGLQFILLQEQEYAIPLMRPYIKPDTAYKEIQPAGNILLPVAESRDFLRRLAFAGEFVLTPGHSDDSVTLVLDSGEAFTGDLPLGMPDGDNLLLRQSREKLRAMGVSRVYQAHGREGGPIPSGDS
ncbi:MBL fold metallo-hydrolase [Puia dinghuensis]|uniref:MBL fold metallo-hydrolase n=1 Tax=Puia dinghuensis TaxID=1792502 RepID=A0A8J2UIQ5_9BACT|nr:MBL fold metallo-hydrolase [Puia dinghuensis]GGB22347.1 MBL fold metallo-hydrolase [Puia dinghuensis]